MDEQHPETLPVAAHPFGLRLHVHFQTEGDLGKLADTQIALAQGLTLSIKIADKVPWGGGVDRILSLMGFATQADAEAAKPRITQALFSMAVGLNVPLLIQAVAVVDRRKSRSMKSAASLMLTKSPDRIRAYLHDAMSHEPMDAPLLLSVELFCSAQFQATPHAVFFAMVSALEPLGEQQRKKKRKGKAAIDFLDRSLAALKDDPDISEADREPLADGLGWLKRETISQSLRRLAAETFPDDPDAAAFVDRAYRWRSQITHSGRITDPDVDLGAQTHALSNWMRRLYGRLLPHPEPGTPQ